MGSLHPELTPAEGVKASLCAVARARFGGALGGYNLAQTSQYHIQTDEGPERYFRYQTDSGQYRKEKRLEDGTVVGTYGWVDADGYLRLRDYIADNQGYRIVRTKKMWVGDEPIGRAVASAKYVPGQGGVGVANAIIPNPTPDPYDVVYRPGQQSVAVPETVYVTPPSPYGLRLSTPSAYLPPATVYLPPVSSTPRPYYPSSTPAVVSSTPRPYYPSSTPVVVSSTPRPYYPSSTPSVSVVSSTARPVVVSSTPRPYYSSASSTTAKPFVVVSSTPAPSYASSSASPSVPDATPSPIRGDDATAYSSPSAPLRPYSSSSGGSSSRPHPFHRGYSSSSSSSNLYDHAVPPRRGYISELPGTYDANSNSVIPEYDGIAVTHNGFRYYLPRQYQEEETLPGDRRAGSFGYVDPFGIRRVIYYNSSPGSGFQVRKNNRYVGFNSTPYDPRF